MKEVEHFIVWFSDGSHIAYPRDLYKIKYWDNTCLQVYRAKTHNDNIEYLENYIYSPNYWQYVEHKKLKSSILKKGK